MSSVSILLLTSTAAIIAQALQNVLKRITFAKKQQELATIAEVFVGLETENTGNIHVILGVAMDFVMFTMRPNANVIIRVLRIVVRILAPLFATKLISHANLYPTRIKQPFRSESLVTHRKANRTIAPGRSSGPRQNHILYLRPVGSRG